MTKPNEPGWRQWIESRPLASMRRELEDLVDGFLDREKLSSQWAALTPRVDVSETDETVEVTADLPGVKPGEVEIELEESRLIISGEHVEQESAHERERAFHRTERRRGRFWRAVPLPCPVQEEGAQAELREGVLHVTLSKTEKAQRRRIRVRSPEGEVRSAEGEESGG